MSAAVSRCFAHRSPRPMLSVRLAAAVLLFCAPLFAQIQPPTPHSSDRPPAKLYPIAGTVTNSVTGEPVPGVTFSLLSGQPPLVSGLARQTVQVVLSDANGHFALNPVPAAKYALRASRRGFMTQLFDQHDSLDSAIVTGEGLDTEHIPFQLPPVATIRGRVTDDAGEPVDKASVLLVRRTKNGGLGDHLVKVISGQTDDTGLYEFWNLLPGTYFLAVKADPWFALHPFLSSQNQAVDPEQREAEKALDVAWPITYYGDVTDEAAATPIPITNGDRAEANVVLQTVPAVHLSLRGGSDSGDPRFRGPRTMRQTIFGDQDFTAYPTQRPGAEGSGQIELAGIAPGHYAITEGTPPHVTEVDTNGDQEIDLSAAAALSSVEINVRMADGSSPPDNLQIGLMSDDSIHRVVTGSVLSHRALFSSIAPGRWNLLPTSQGLTLAVISVESGQTASPDSRIVVKSQHFSVTAVIARGKTSVEGFAVRDGKGEPGIMVVLVPKNPQTGLALFRRDQSDSDGSFLLPNIIPGNYTIVALRDAWDLDWARPEVISRYLKEGVPVTVPENAPALIRLNSTIPIQQP